MVKVTHFYRAPRNTGVSIEGIFKAVKECLKGSADIDEYYCDAALSRVQNAQKAGRAAGHINHITGDVNYLAIAFGGKKNIITIHDFGHYENLKKSSFLRFINYRLFWFVLPLKNTDIVTVVSEFTRKKLIDYLGYPEHKIRVIYDPVKPVFQFTPKDKLHDVPRILQIGTGPHKNLKTLIEAAKGMKVHIDIIGYPDAQDTASLSQYNISHTIYNNLTDKQIFERYAACDILYFASLHEGFGMPIIEAQCVGRPVITSNYGAMLEVAKQSALLVNPLEPQEVRVALEQLIGNRELYQKMVTLGQENIIPFRIDIIARQYLEVYNELNTN